MLAKDKVPDAVALLCGVKVTSREMLCPAAIVMGNEVPARENCALLLAEEEMVTAAPEALRLSV